MYYWMSLFVIHYSPWSIGGGVVTFNPSPNYPRGGHDRIHSTTLYCSISYSEDTLVTLQSAVSA